MRAQNRRRVQHIALVMCAGISLVLAACGVQRPVYVAGVPEGLVAPGEPASAAESRVAPDRNLKPAEISGRATWYGDRHHGRLTANGEMFDMHAFTAAHRTLPFNTLVRVTHTKTGESVIVRVNDRGPGKKSLVIDLSKEAARRLNMVKRGVAPVQLEIVSWGDGARYHHGRKTLPKKKKKRRSKKTATMTQTARSSKTRKARPSLRTLSNRGDSQNTPQLRTLPTSDPKEPSNP